MEAPTLFTFAMLRQRGRLVLNTLHVHASIRAGCRFVHGTGKGTSPPAPSEAPRSYARLDAIRRLFVGHGTAPATARIWPSLKPRPGFVWRFLGWTVVAHGVALVAAPTTLASVYIALANVTGLTDPLLTRILQLAFSNATGINIRIESIEPRWLDSRLRLHNVQLLRRSQGALKGLREDVAESTFDLKDSVTGSGCTNSDSATVGSKDAATGSDPATIVSTDDTTESDLINSGSKAADTFSSRKSSNDITSPDNKSPVSKDDSVSENITHFYIRMAEVDMDFDFIRWLRDLGLVRKCTFRGMRAVIDRRHLNFDNIPPESWLALREPTPYDFHFKQTEFEDCIVSIWDYGGFRPYTVTMHKALMQRLRLQWLLHDILSSDLMVGEWDGAQCSLVRPQEVASIVSPDAIAEMDLSPLTQPSTGTTVTMPTTQFPLPSDPKLLSRMRRMRMSGLNLDMFNYGAKGAIGWIDRGTLDVDAYIVFPPEDAPSNAASDTSPLLDIDPFDADDERLLVKLTSEIDQLKDALLNDVVEPIRQRVMEDLHRRRDAIEGEDNTPSSKTDSPKDKSPTPDETALPKSPTRPPRIRFHTDIRLNNIRATIPDHPPIESESQIPLALIRPVVAYLNAQPTAPRGQKSAAPPISCSFSLPLSQMDGAWTIYQGGLLDALSVALANSLAKIVVVRYVEYQKRGRRTQRNVEHYHGSATWERWLPWLSSYEEEDYVIESEVNEDTPDTIDESELIFEELLQSGDPAPRGISLLSRVFWWNVQQAGKDALQTPAVDPVSADVEDERMIEVYNEMVWGL